MNEESLFQEAVRKPTERERAKFLDESCVGNPELRDAVMALLAGRGAPGSRFNSPSAEAGETIDSETGPAALAVTGDIVSESGPAAVGPDATQEVTPSPNTPSAQSPFTAEYRGLLQVGSVIAGRYTLEAKIGEGGMGDVWVARQTEPVKRRIALKLIKPGMDSRAMLARFEQERQALAIWIIPISPRCSTAA